MTISTEPNPLSYSGNGATVNFAITWKYLSKEHVVVTHRSASAVETTWILNTDYTLTAAGVDAGGTLTATVAPATGTTIVITLEPPNTQETSLPLGGQFPSVSVENALDIAAQRSGKLESIFTRAIRVPRTDTQTGDDLEIPIDSERAGKYLAFDSNGMPIASVGSSDNIGPITAFANTLLGGENAAAMFSTLGVTAYIQTLLDDSTAAAARTTLGLGTAATQNVGTSENNVPQIRANGSIAARVVRHVARRQTTLSGGVDSNGQANYIVAGSGLACNLNATAKAVIDTFAAGFDDDGEVNYVKKTSADVTGAWSSLPASNLSFLYKTYDPALDTLSYAHTLVQPQYGYAYDRTRNALLRFEGADASTTILDDYGNTWTASGNAQIDTAQFKFEASSLLLDGTGDYIRSTNFKTVGSDSWEISLWFRLNALPGSGSQAHLLNLRSAANPTTIALKLALFNNAGTTRLDFNASSNGTSLDIANGVAGTNTTWALNQWNKVRLVFDSVAGTYRVYLSLNGAAETQDISVASTAKLCSLEDFVVGADAALTGSFFNGWIDALRLVPCATKTTTETPSASAPAITDFPVHYFSIPEMTMYEVTSASASAGTNPGMTARQRLFVGEATTGVASVSSVVTYALMGRSRGPVTNTIPVAGTTISYSHNIGVIPEIVQHMFKNLTTEHGYSPGDEVRPTAYGGALTGFPEHAKTRNTFKAVVGATNDLVVDTTGALVAVTKARWGYFGVADRGW